jgi:drug/metabolite transporter (DMT)-like permease
MTMRPRRLEIVWCLTIALLGSRCYNELDTSVTQTKLPVLLMIGAMFVFTLMDAVAKVLTQEIGVWPTLWIRYLGQAVLVCLIVLPRFGKITKTSFPLLQLARSVFLMCATMCFFWGISNIGLAEATAIMDISPVLITLGAVLFLGERIGIRRVIGIIGALIGAMIVIRPGSDVFSVYALFPLGAAICYSGYNIITRFVGAREDPWTSLFYTALFGAIVFSTIVPFHWQPLGAFTMTLMAALSVMATLAQWLLIKALSLGEASLLAPIGYIALIFATLWGLLLFGDLPDQWTVIGALVIVASGVYVWSRERKAG